MDYNEYNCKEQKKRTDYLILGENFDDTGLVDDAGHLVALLNEANHPDLKAPRLRDVLAIDGGLSAR